MAEPAERAHHDRTASSAPGAAEPDIRPLGWLAIAFAGLSAVCALSYFFSPLTFLAALVAVPLGLAARSDERTRDTGTTAVVIALVACVGAVLMLVFAEGGI